MRSGHLLTAGVLLFGALLFPGCATDSDQTITAENASVTLTKAYITQAGDEIEVSGLHNGIESRFLASKVTIDGVDASDQPSLFRDTDPSIITCLVCVCSGNSCICTEIKC